MTTGWAVPGFTDIRMVRDDPVGRRVVARNRVSRRIVLITYLSREFCSDLEFRCRFRVEATRLMRVHDARVARVRRYVEHESDPAAAAVVTDRAAGMSLRELLLEESALGTDAALVVLKDVLRALAAADAFGVAHGDLKPEGMVLTSTGGVRLVDFGLYTGAGRRSLTRSTPFYLAPELWDDSAATVAADLYTATVTFFECLAGAPPFHAADSAQLALLHRNGAPPLDAIPAAVHGLVLDGLAKDPGSRPGPLRFLTQVERAALAARGAGWERRGRQELIRLLTAPGHPPPLPVLAARPAGRLGWERRQPVRLAAALGGAMALAAGLSSPVPPGGLFRMQTDAPGSGDRPPVMAFPGPAEDSGVQEANALQGSTASGTEHTRSVLLTQPESAVPAVAQSPAPGFGAASRAPAVEGVNVRPADDLAPIPAPRSAGHDVSRPHARTYQTSSPGSLQHDATACDVTGQGAYQGAGAPGDGPRHASPDVQRQPREMSGGAQPGRARSEDRPQRPGRYDEGRHDTGRHDAGKYDAGRYDGSARPQRAEKADRPYRGERARTYATAPRHARQDAQTTPDATPRHRQRVEPAQENQDAPSPRSISPRQSSPYQAPVRQASAQESQQVPSQQTAPRSVPRQQSGEQLSAHQSAVEKVARSGRAAEYGVRSGSDTATDTTKTDTTKTERSADSGTQSDYSAKTDQRGTADSGSTDSARQSTGKHHRDTGSGSGTSRGTSSGSDSGGGDSAAEGSSSGEQ